MYYCTEQLYTFAFCTCGTDWKTCDKLPLLLAIRYLEEDHIQYCVPSSVSSGLSSLPVSYVYVNGSANISQTTTKVLPFGQPLNGSKAYMELLSFFTTTNSTPDEVYNLGYDMLRKLYPEVTHYYRELCAVTLSLSLCLHLSWVISKQHQAGVNFKRLQGTLTLAMCVHGLWGEWDCCPQ